MNKIIFALLFLCFLPICNAQIIEDEFSLKIPIENIKKPERYINYNYESTIKIPIKLTSLDVIKTENTTYEGQTIRFKVAENVYHNNQLVVARNTPSSAKVNVLISPGMNGIPASIIFGDFQIDGIKSSKLDDTYEKFGQDRSLFVFPLKWALTPLPPTGSLTNFIKGGHAKLKYKDEIEIYYHPEWI